jgi:hypothetical protein
MKFKLSWIDYGVIMNVQGDANAIHYLYWALNDGTRAESIKIFDSHNRIWSIDELLDCPT